MLEIHVNKNTQTERAKEAQAGRNSNKMNKPLLLP